MFKLPSGSVLYSKMIEPRLETVTRSHYWFEARKEENKIFGQALIFYEDDTGEGEEKLQEVVVYNPLVEIVKT